jgi:hypothetical protein
MYAKAGDSADLRSVRARRPVGHAVKFSDAAEPNLLQLVSRLRNLLKAQIDFDPGGAQRCRSCWHGGQMWPSSSAFVSRAKAAIFRI